MKTLFNNNPIAHGFLLVFALLFHFSATAQLKPVNAIYYFNEYLMNPAMAGKEKVFKGSIGYRKQFSSFGNAPQTQFIAADYGFDTKSGVGLKIFNDQAGLLGETAIAASYAYHLMLTEENRLSFGLSGSYTKQRLNSSSFSGELDDPDVLDLEQRKGVFDSDFGMAYTSETFSLQVVFPNMINTLKNDESNGVNYTTLFAAVSYKLATDLGILEPKLAFRGIKGRNSIIDFGANFTLNASRTNQFNVMALYHSSKNATLGASILFNDRFSFNTSYTIGTGQLNSYSNGDFELGLGIKL